MKTLETDMAVENRFEITVERKCSPTRTEVWTWYGQYREGKKNSPQSSFLSIGCSFGTGRQ